MDVERQIRNALKPLREAGANRIKKYFGADGLFRIVLPWNKNQSTQPGQKSEISRRSVIPKKRKSALIIAPALPLLIGIGWGWMTLPRKTAPAPPSASRITSLAVLPFKNYSNAPNQEYLRME